MLDTSGAGELSGRESSAEHQAERQSREDDTLEVVVMRVGRPYRFGLRERQEVGAVDIEDLEQDERADEPETRQVDGEQKSRPASASEGGLHV